MIIRLVASLNLILGTAVTAMIAADMAKERIQKLAEKDKVYSAREYVLVRLARGEYNRPNGIETMRYDYKFYETISGQGI